MFQLERLSTQVKSSNYTGQLTLFHIHPILFLGPGYCARGPAFVPMLSTAFSSPPLSSWVLEDYQIGPMAASECSKVRDPRAAQGEQEFVHIVGRSRSWTVGAKTMLALSEQYHHTYCAQYNLKYL